MTKPLNRILIVSLDNIGDSVMATAILSPLRQLYPNAKIGMWVKKYTADLFSGLSDVDILHASDPFWDRSPGRKKGDMKTFMAVWKEIKSQKYEAAFVLNSEWRRTLACWLAGIPNRVGFARRKSALFLSQAVPSAKMGTHFVDDHNALVKAWSDKASLSSYSALTLSDDEQEEALEWKKAPERRESPIIGVHFFSGDIRKNWSLENWSEFLRLIKNEKAPCQVVSFASQSEAPLLKDFSAIKGVEIVAGASLSSVKAVISQVDIFVGGDSGLGHVAAALGKPVISLFGIDNAGRCSPRGKAPGEILYSDPLDQLDPKDVFDALKAHLVKNNLWTN